MMQVCNKACSNFLLLAKRRRVVWYKQLSRLCTKRYMFHALRVIVRFQRRDALVLMPTQNRADPLTWKTCSLCISLSYDLVLQLQDDLQQVEMSP